ncbi:SCO4226 family nickel-binding protein [Streptomyces sp. NPDC053048]|uniref:SCO4226 family nickel-binding protein n=1 Tax=Streptomyces sp. NPDC053048 TaxID=3365694 RepID=UPI0037D037E3
MTKFMDVHHDMKGITEDQLKAAHRADQAIEREEGVHFERAWADPKSGTVYCLSEGPSADAVKRIHERAGHPTDEIHPVPYTIS